VVIVFQWSSASIFSKLSYDLKVATVHNRLTYEMFVLIKYCFRHNLNFLP
jgi:hypothetical protein